MYSARKGIKDLKISPLNAQNTPAPGLYLPSFWEISNLKVQENVNL